MPVLTLTGSAQRLSSFAAIGTKTVRAITFQAGVSNGAPIYITTDATITLSATDYDVRLPVPVTSIPAAPFMCGDQVVDTLSTAQFWVLGTNNEKLHVMVL
jgi:hypothetical protein